MQLILVASLLFSDPSMATPKWAQENTLSREGSTLRLVAIGRGHSLAQARESAMDQCRGSVVSQVQRDFSVKSQAIQSERDVVLSQAIEHSGNYSGVDCITEKEAVEVHHDAAIVYSQFRVDLSAVKQTSRKMEGRKEPRGLEPFSLNDDVPSANTLSLGVPKSVSRQLIVTSVPGKCSSVMIETKSVPKLIRCEHNPQVVTIPDFREVIALEVTPAKSGYLPRRITLHPSNFPESIDVQYEQP